MLKSVIEARKFHCKNELKFKVAFLTTLFTFVNDSAKTVQKYRNSLTDTKRP